MAEQKKKVKTILISQPKPEGKSPYANLEKKHKVKIDFRPFMHVEEITAMEFKEQRISILNHDAVIFTSKNAMDHYFGMMEKLRLRVPDFTKYFCVSEAIAHYLQNFITYRKRKVFTGEQTLASLIPIMQKHKESKFMFPCSDVLKKQMNKSLEESGLDYTKIDGNINGEYYTYSSSTTTKTNNMFYPPFDWMILPLIFLFFLRKLSHLFSFLLLGNEWSYLIY